jgi:transposase
VIEAIAWKYRTGSPWREIPERFGPWQTAYERHSRWTVDGTWARLLAAAHVEADAAGDLDWLVSADSSLVRVHQHGAAAPRIGGNAATAVGPVWPAAPAVGLTGLVTGGTVESQESA